MQFRYSFQKIVDLKGSEKTLEEWKLSLAVGRLTQEQSRLSSLHGRKEELQQIVSAAAAGRTSVSELMLMQRYMDHLDRQIKTKRQDVLTAERTVSVQQGRLSAKMLEEKVWTKAREKALQQFSARVRKKEQEELDEMATVRFKQPT